MASVLKSNVLSNIQMTSRSGLTSFGTTYEDFPQSCGFEINTYTVNNSRVTFIIFCISTTILHLINSFLFKPRILRHGKFSIINTY